MIISHSQRYIFFAVPKTATHSIREALRRSKSERDWEQQILFGAQTIPIPDIAKIRHGHISARQIAPALDAEQWQEYFKFGFVRNPFDRFVSICAFLNRQNAHYKGSELAWMKSAIKRPAFLQRILVRPQFEQLIGADNQLALDYIGRYEDLQPSLDHILANLSLEPVKLKVRNASQHSSYRDYYDKELRDWVANFYRGDIECFNYQY